jgi:hypothetical protein
MPKSAWPRALAAVAALMFVLPAAADAQPKPKTGSLTQVGHEPLQNRGMNAAIAVHGDYAYIGSRTDGSHDNPAHGGIMVVDISDPSSPELLNPDAPIDANPGESSRELRVWAEQDILIVLNTNCGGEGAHQCQTPSINNFRFYDISGENAANPQLIHQMDMSTHEFYLWVDPTNPDRALMYGGSAGNRFTVWDISPLRFGLAPIVLDDGPHGFTEVPSLGIPRGGLHSLSINNEGTRAYYALLTGGFGVVDVSEFRDGVPNPQQHPITINEERPTWPGPGTHSAIKLFEKDWVYVSDEVYGTATGSAHGCPWGWARMIDISDPERPTVEAEYRLPENDESTCAAFNPPRTSYSAHNPTQTRRMVLTTWHSGGFQVINVQHPRSPTQLAEFFPEPLDEVSIEDPRLSSDPDTGRNEKVVMWSYPIVKDGLIYVVDLRNGLYVLEYEGRFENEIEHIRFLEGNSNQGDALCFEPVDGMTAACD